MRELFELINKIVLGYFKTRYNDLGKNQSGMYNYYHELMSNGNILREEDYYIACYIKENYDAEDVIHEMACGAAQLGHLLSLIGFKNVIATEMDKKRYKLAAGLGKILSSDCIIKNENSFNQDTTYDLVVTNNAVSSTTTFADAKEYFQKVLKSGGNIIINPNIFDGNMNRELLLDNFTKIEIGFTELEYDYVKLEVL